MSAYFKYFPKVEYDVQKTSNLDVATNILKRFSIKASSVNNTAVFYDYNIVEGDRPDSVANKLYGDPDLAWVILFFNRSINPLFDWPLTSEQFQRYIIEKYGSLSLAKTTVHHYEKIIEAEQTLVTGEFKVERTIIIDQTTYNSTAADSRHVIYSYYYEENLNNARGVIKVVSPAYITDILNQASNILSN